MQKNYLSVVLMLALGSSVLAQADDFQRERKPGETVKDSIEGKAPPALKVKEWMNTGGRALDLASLRGKVVVLDFWGNW